MSNHTDIAVIGGGVIGLSIAFRLAGEGLTVAVVDAELPGQASSAAAGMLAPFGESSGPGPFIDLGLRSLAFYPEFAEELRAVSRIDPEFEGPGMLRVARTDQEERALCAAFAWQSDLGLPMYRLSGHEARRLEPNLSLDIRTAILSPAERRVAPVQLLKALRKACERSKVHFGKPALVLGAEFSSASIKAVSTTTGWISAGTFILAAGTWSDKLARTLRLPPVPVRPVKGQILALGPFEQPPFQHTIFTHGRYLVPRADGRVVLGATEEDDGSFSAKTTPGGIQALRDGLPSLAPCLADAPVHSAWAGLRPVSLDSLPLIGRPARYDNLVIAAGHGRNGILLAPLTAELVTAMITENTAPPLECRPDRFTEAQCAPSS